MAATAAKHAGSNRPVVLICGGDEFLVKQRARQRYDAWCQDAGGMDHEIVDGGASHAGEALRSIARLREALGTLPFFGAAKVIWWRDCTFLGDDRTSGAQAVTAALAELAEELTAFSWDKVRLVISSGKVDKRRVFYKALERVGQVEVFEALSVEDKEWPERAASAVETHLVRLEKEITDDALRELVWAVGPDHAQLRSESEKVATFVGDRRRVEVGDVREVVTRNRQSKAFALGDALGDRDAGRLLRQLENDLWWVSRDRDKSEIGLLYGLISKTRSLLLARELLIAGSIRASESYPGFKSQWEKLLNDQPAADRKNHPFGVNPFVMFRATQQALNYTLPELVRAMGLLLECNRRLVSSSLDDRFLLQRTLIEIVSRPQETPAPAH